MALPNEENIDIAGFSHTPSVHSPANPSKSDNPTFYLKIYPKGDSYFSCCLLLKRWHEVFALTCLFCHFLISNETGFHQENKSFFAIKESLRS